MTNRDSRGRFTSGGEGEDLADVVRGLPDAFTRVKESFELLLGPLKAITEGYRDMKEAVEDVLKLFEKAVDIAVDVVKAYEAQEEAERRLITTATARGQITEELLGQAKEFTEILQRQTGIADQVTLGFQAQLLAMGVYRQDLDKATLAAIGFSEAHGVSMETAVKVVGKVIQGNTDVLKRYGETSHDVNETINRYVELSDLSIQRGETLGGKVSILKGAWEDLEETLGKSIEKSQLIGETLGDLITIVEGVTRVAKGLPSFDRLVELANALGAVMPIIGPLVQGSAQFVQQMKKAADILAGLLTEGDDESSLDARFDAFARAEERKMLARLSSVETVNAKAAEAAAKARAAERKRLADAQAEENVNESLEEFKLLSVARQFGLGEEAKAHEDSLAELRRWLQTRLGFIAMAEDDEIAQTIRGNQELTRSLAARQRIYENAGEAHKKQQAAADAFEIAADDKRIARQDKANATLAAGLTGLVTGIEGTLESMAAAFGSGDAEKGAEELSFGVLKIIGQFAVMMGNATIASGIAAANLGNPFTAVAAGVVLAGVGATILALVGAAQGALAKNESASTKTPNTFQPNLDTGSPTASPTGPGGGEVPSGPDGGRAFNVFIGNGAIVGGNGHAVGRDLLREIAAARPSWH